MYLSGLGYFFQVRPGVDLERASRDLASRFAPTYGLQVQQLYNSEQNASQANMTLFLGSTLILGLLFGALAIGVITSRSVLERRQQIGMLRALGFSRGLVLCSFLLEASFVITLSLLIGTSLGRGPDYQRHLSRFSRSDHASGTADDRQLPDCSSHDCATLACGFSCSSGRGAAL